MFVRQTVLRSITAVFFALSVLLMITEMLDTRIYSVTFYLFLYYLSPVAGLLTALLIGKFEKLSLIVLTVATCLLHIMIFGSQFKDLPLDMSSTKFELISNVLVIAGCAALFLGGVLLRGLPRRVLCLCACAAFVLAAAFEGCICVRYLVTDVGLTNLIRTSLLAVCKSLGMAGLALQRK